MQDQPVLFVNISETRWETVDAAFHTREHPEREENTAINSAVSTAIKASTFSGTHFVTPRSYTAELDQSAVIAPVETEPRPPRLWWSSPVWLLGSFFRKSAEPVPLHQRQAASFALITTRSLTRQLIFNTSRGMASTFELYATHHAARSSGLALLGGPTGFCADCRIETKRRSGSVRLHAFVEFSRDHDHDLQRRLSESHCGSGG